MKKTMVKFGLLLVLVFTFMTFVSAQYNYDHVNVTSRVNVTNAFPEILEVLVDQDIVLNAGGLKTVYCNATIRDWNGWDDIVGVNATLFHSTSTSGSADNNNTHYTNTTCFNYDDDGNKTAYYQCSFDLLYYANPGSWTCNVTAIDAGNFEDDLSNTTLINELYALNVTDVVDYGDLAVMDTSLEISAFVTNFGNTNINVSVLGYGAVEGDNLGLICALGDDIAVEHQRFSATSGVWGDKTPLASTNQDMSLTINQATDATVPTIWETFWQLYVPPNPQGECTGTLRFTATTTT